MFLCAQWSVAQNSATEQQIKDLSKTKLHWMADKDVDKLASLFHEKAKFVHMSGTWKKSEELDIIKTGSIWYKNAEVHDVVIEITDDVAVLWNRSGTPIKLNISNSQSQKEVSYRKSWPHFILYAKSTCSTLMTRVGGGQLL